MNNNKEMLNDKELENANGGMKIVIDYHDNQLLEKLKDIVKKMKDKLNKK